MANTTGHPITGGNKQRILVNFFPSPGSGDPFRKRTAFVAADNLIQHQDHPINAPDEEVVTFMLRAAHPGEQGSETFTHTPVLPIS